MSGGSSNAIHPTPEQPPGDLAQILGIGNL